MIRLFGSLLFLGLGCLTGCTDFGNSSLSSRKSMPIPETNWKTSPPGGFELSPDEITPQNAHQVTQKLWDQMDKSVSDKTR